MIDRLSEIEARAQAARLGEWSNELIVLIVKDIPWLLGEVRRLKTIEAAAREYVEAEVEDTVMLRALEEGGVAALNAQQIARHKADVAFSKLCAAVVPEPKEPGD